MSEDELDLIAVYAVGALDGAELDDADGLLADDPDLRSALDRHLETLALLTDDVEPPAGLLDAILARTESPLRVARRPEEEPPPTRRPSMTPPPHVTPTDLYDARRRRRGRVARTVLAAAAVVAVLLLAVGLLARDDPDDLADLATNALDDPDARVVDLALPDTTDAVARAAVFDDGAGFLVLDDLPAIGGDETYQLWMLPSEGTDPISLGLVDPATNDGAAAFQIDPGAAGLGLSREPAGGSVTPTEVVAVGTFT